MFEVKINGEGSFAPNVETADSSTHWYHSTELHGIISQKPILFIFEILKYNTVSYLPVTKSECNTSSGGSML
jgi:hypothetical protein